MDWKYVFKECGGYDCMTDAFIISKDGIDTIVIDLAYFDQERCKPETGRKKDAENIAEIIVEALNNPNTKEARRP